MIFSILVNPIFLKKMLVDPTKLISSLQPAV